MIPPPAAPFLVTERLELWLPRGSDLREMLAIVSVPRTSRYLGPADGPAEHFTRFCRNAGSWLLYGYGSFILRLRGEPEVIGNCGIFHSWRGLGEDFDDQPEDAKAITRESFEGDWHFVSFDGDDPFDDPVIRRPESPIRYDKIKISSEGDFTLVGYGKHTGFEFWTNWVSLKKFLTATDPAAKPVPDHG